MPTIAYGIWNSCHAYANGVYPAPYPTCARAASTLASLATRVVTRSVTWVVAM